MIRLQKEYWVKFTDKTNDYVQQLQAEKPEAVESEWTNIPSSDRRVQRFLFPQQEGFIRTRKFIKWRINSLDQLNGLADLFDFGSPKPVFRGQSQYSWGLKTKLERDINQQAIDAHGIEYVEHRLLVESQRRLQNYVSERPDIEDCFSWIALLRHHGVSTRLLDVTRSIFVACYFAMRDSKLGDDAALWIFNRNALSGAFTDWQIYHQERVWRPSPFSAYVDNDYNWPSPRNPRKFPPPITYESLLDGTCNKWLNYSAVIEAALLGHIDKRGVGLAEPYWLSPRNDIQQGEFLIPFNSRHSFKDNLSAYLGIKEDLNSPDGETEMTTDKDELFGSWADGAIFKVRLCADFHSALKVRLKSMNIRELTLFPDVGGAMEHISSFVPPKF